jgi:hypothetical protein
MSVSSKSRARTVSACAAASLMAFSASARAEVLFDSLHSPNTAVMAGVMAGDFSLAFDATFATGASTFHATDIALLLSQSFTLPGDTFIVSLEGGVPLADVTFDPGFGLSVTPGGPVLDSVTLPISDLSTSLMAEHFNQFATIALKPNSLYWIDLNLSDQASIDGASVGWGTTDDNSGPGVAAGYNSSNATDHEFFPNNRDFGEQAFQMEVSGTAVPESSTWALMLAGFAGLGLIAYRRRAALASSGA